MVAPRSLQYEIDEGLEVVDGDPNEKVTVQEEP